MGVPCFEVFEIFRGIVYVVLYRALCLAICICIMPNCSKSCGGLRELVLIVDEYGMVDGDRCCRLCL